MTKDNQVLQSISPSKIILPILLGLGVVAYMFYKDYDPEALKQIKFTSNTLFWILMAILCAALRHFAYMARLRLMTDNFFSWKKSLELLFIWEFSSCVSPTSVGGSAVALFVLSHEKLSTGKTATIVVYSVIFDTIFFIIGIPFWYFILGPELLTGIKGNWTSFLYPAYAAMLIYGLVFFYGIFIGPRLIKRLLFRITSLKPLKRFRKKMVQLGNDMIVASDEMKKKNIFYHLKTFFWTAIAWSMRFILLNCLIIALFSSLNADFGDQLMIFARQKAMYVIMALSPTPGGVGFAEWTCRDFLHDFVPVELSTVLSLPWRFLTYYIFLFVGVFVVPNWVRKVLNNRKKEKA